MEAPLIRQLEDMGWGHLVGAPPGTSVPSGPGASGRGICVEVLLVDRLWTALREINVRPGGGSWLDSAGGVPG
ncbi:hypothetical protein [Actinomadura sp. CNU-125]|uniref:hypothetical protein n=1 Tax=Actinomadura sp. CNU-125 TaxID=1904961 RepID=UPI001177D20B|nr:hypothetical protein [Actinomadura sp. CNU-125]